MSIGVEFLRHKGGVGARVYISPPPYLIITPIYKPLRSRLIKSVFGIFGGIITCLQYSRKHFPCYETIVLMKKEINSSIRKCCSLLLDQRNPWMILKAEALSREGHKRLTYRDFTGLLYTCASTNH